MEGRRGRRSERERGTATGAEAPNAEEQGAGGAGAAARRAARLEPPRRLPVRDAVAVLRLGVRRRGGAGGLRLTPATGRKGGCALTRKGRRLVRAGGGKEVVAGARCVRRPRPEAQLQHVAVLATALRLGVHCLGLKGQLQAVTHTRRGALAGEAVRRLQRDSRAVRLDVDVTRLGRVAARQLDRAHAPTGVRLCALGLIA